MRPSPIPEQPLLEIAELYTFYHFHFATGYVFRGERHPFWEMVYVRNGQVDIGADERMHLLTRGDLIFHRPDEFHSIWANYAHTADMIVVSFRCDSPAMAFFERRRFRLTDAQQDILQMLLREAEQTFVTPLEQSPWAFRPGHPGGAYTLRLILTHLLMELLSRDAPPPSPDAVSREPDADTAALLARLIDAMRGDLAGGLRFPDLCRRVGMSQTSVKQLFRRHFETTPMAYYEQLRMNEARLRLRRPGSTVTQVACELGFSSPNYFATRFRRVTGLTPREFLKDAPLLP